MTFFYWQCHQRNERNILFEKEKSLHSNIRMPYKDGLGLWCLTSLSTIFHSYRYTKMEWKYYSIYLLHYEIIFFNWITVIGLNPPHFCACPSSGPGIPMSCRASPFFVFSELSWELIVCLVDIGTNVDYHCLKLSFKIMGEKKNFK